MTNTPQARAVASTPLGDVTLEVGGSSDVVIVVVPAEVPDLPKGVAVDGVLLLSIQLAAPVTAASPVQLTVTADGVADPESGEWLESVAFERDGGVLQVAIRDDEWLAGRGIVAEMAWYDRPGFSQVIREAPGGTVLLVGVAWRSGSAPDADDRSTWLAADLVMDGSEAAMERAAGAAPSDPEVRRGVDAERPDPPSG